MLLLLDDSVLFFEGFNIVIALPPTSTVVKLTQLCAFFDGFTNGVEEQIYICGKVDVGFDHKGVTATAEADVVFFYQGVP